MLAKSPRPDSLYPRVVKELAVEMLDALVVNFHHSSGTLPNDWRVINIIPIFKKKKRQRKSRQLKACRVDATVLYKGCNESTGLFMDVNHRIDEGESVYMYCVFRFPENFQEGPT